jgi:hypothetical protein
MINTQRIKYFPLNSEEFLEFYNIYMNSPVFTIRQRVQIIMLWTKGYKVKEIGNILHFDLSDDYVEVYNKAYRYGGIDWLMNDDIDFLRDEISKIETRKRISFTVILNSVIKIIGWVIFLLFSPLFLLLLPFYLIHFLFSIDFGINVSDRLLNIRLPKFFFWLPRLVEIFILPLVIVLLVLFSPILLFAYFLSRLSISLTNKGQNSSKSIKIDVSESTNVSVQIQNEEGIDELGRKLDSLGSNVGKIIKFLDEYKDTEKRSNKSVYNFFFKIDEFNRKTVNWRVITMLVAIFLATYILVQSKILTIFGSVIILGLLISVSTKGCDIRKFNTENLEESKEKIKIDIQKDTFLVDSVHLIIPHTDDTFYPDEKCKFRSVMGTKQDSIIKIDTTLHEQQDYFVKELNNRIYLYVVGYNNIKKAALQRKYVVQNGFVNSKVLPVRYGNSITYFVTICDFEENELSEAGVWQNKWNIECKDEAAKTHILVHK